MKVYDAIDREGGSGEQARGELKSIIWIHRCGFEAGHDAAAVARFFRTGPGAPYTGGQMAYHYVNTLERVEQALPLMARGAHARRFNVDGIGFAQLGDFNAAPPTAYQWERALQLCADLLPILLPQSRTLRGRLPAALRHELPVYGHGEVPAAFSEGSGKHHPNGPHDCPGRHWPMQRFRDDLRRELLRRAVIDLAHKGHTIGES